jgi:hypothetical protein
MIGEMLAKGGTTAAPGWVGLCGHNRHRASAYMLWTGITGSSCARSRNSEAGSGLQVPSTRYSGGFTSREQGDAATRGSAAEAGEFPLRFARHRPHRQFG